MLDLQKLITFQEEYICSVQQVSPHFAKILEHSLSGKAKYFRAQLLVASAELAPCSHEQMLQSHIAALAIELVHAYSLCHDDLPCMDDDHLRRGRAATHCQFDEASAVLAGDGLLTDAFRILLAPHDIFTDIQDDLFSNSLKVRLTQSLSQASGSWGMVAGQELDMRLGDCSGEVELATLEKIHRLKTGALIATSLKMGGYIAQLSTASIQLLEDIGLQLGLAYQIQDDLLDTDPQTGKSAGKDLAQNKWTYLRFYSPEDAKIKLTQLKNQIYTGVEQLNGQSETLTDLLHTIFKRSDC